MSTFPVAFDISHNKDLLQLAEEVQKTKTPRALVKENETVAVIMPVEKARERHAEINSEGLLNTFGTWKDVDTERLKADIFAARQNTNTRPLVKL